MVDANIKDAPLRLHCSPDVVYDLPLDSNDGALVKIRKVLTRHLAQTNPAFVLPLGLGHHIDHLVAKEAASSLVADLPCAFYEDLPDAFRVDVAADPRDLTAVFAPDPQTPAWKRKAILLYNSQINAEIADRIVDYSQQETERVWGNAAFADLISR